MTVQVDVRQAITCDVRSFIVSTFLTGETEDELRDDDLLLEGGIIDSGSVVMLVAFLETKFDIEVRDEDLFAENFATITRIVSFVIGKTRA
jgi:acyl carrier protein